MKKSIRIALTVVLALTLVFIWGNSLLPSDLSGRESEWVRLRLTPVLEYLHSGRLQAALTGFSAHLPAGLRRGMGRLIALLEEKLLSQPDYFLVRKAAHFFQFAALGLLLGVLTRGRLWLAAPGCFAAAVIDEAIQLGSAGRSAQWRDVGVDMSGAAFGLLIALLALFLLRPRGKSSPDSGESS